MAHSIASYFEISRTKFEPWQHARSFKIIVLQTGVIFDPLRCEKVKYIFLIFNFWFNNFILRWYYTIAEANKNRPLITINMVKIYHVGADTKAVSMCQPYTAMSIPHWYQNRFMDPQGE